MSRSVIAEHFPTGDPVEGGYVVLEPDEGGSTDLLAWEGFFGDGATGEEATFYRVVVADNPMQDLDWVNWKSVAATVGMSVDEIRELGKGNEVDRAQVYEIVAQTHGWHELDQYPYVVPVDDIPERFPDIFSEPLDLLDPDSEVQNAIESTIEEMADQQAVAGLSDLGDEDMIRLDELGFDSQSAIKISETYKATGVNGEVMFDEPLREVRKEVAKDEFEFVKELSGAWPGGLEEEIQLDFVVSAVARDLKVPEKRVSAVFEIMVGKRKVNEQNGMIYWGSDNVDTNTYAIRKE